jgi:hypothetical protein
MYHKIITKAAAATAQTKQIILCDLSSGFFQLKRKIVVFAQNALRGRPLENTC